MLDPATGRPFPGNVIPQARISPQAASLLSYYPLPNLDRRRPLQLSDAGARHQAPGRRAGPRTRKAAFGRNQLFGNLALQRTTTDAGNVFGFTDSTPGVGHRLDANWSHRFSQFLSLRLRYQFTRLTNDVTPYFANRTNVSGDAGITGNNQDPVNWGPPRLQFASGIAGLGQRAGGGQQQQHARRRASRSSTGAAATTSPSAATSGGSAGTSCRSRTRAAPSPSPARHRLGPRRLPARLPHTSAIAFGNADKDFIAPAYDAYVTDDWRVSPVLTVNAGVRWEYEGADRRAARPAGRISTSRPASPATVRRGRPATYPIAIAGLARPPAAPRHGAASGRRVVAGHSRRLRHLSQHRRLSADRARCWRSSRRCRRRSASRTAPRNPLTLANGFIAPPGATLNTFAVDPDFRVGYAAQLAGARAARPAGVADDHRDLSRHERAVT